MAISKSLRIAEVVQVQYCDDAFFKLRIGEMERAPFNLLNTDQSFKLDHRAQIYTSKDLLTEAVKREYPPIKSHCLFVRRPAAKSPDSYATA